jgi:hypothetical protein
MASTSQHTSVGVASVVTGTLSVLLESTDKLSKCKAAHDLLNTLKAHYEKSSKERECLESFIVRRLRPNGNPLVESDYEGHVDLSNAKSMASFFDSPITWVGHSEQQPLSKALKTLKWLRSLRWQYILYTTLVLTYKVNDDIASKLGAFK